MSKYHGEGGKPSRVSEPVQVYLGSDEQARLERLTSTLSTTKSAVLRRGLEALERELADPSAHPALGVLTLGWAALTSPPVYDVALEHDRFLAESEVVSWTPGPQTGRER